MAIYVERTKKEYDVDDSAYSSTVIQQFRGVRPTASCTSGSMLVDQCDTLGEFCYGIALAKCAIGDTCPIAVEGIVEVEAGEAFNCGTKLMVAANGTFITATTTKLVRAIAREASRGTNHLVSVLLVDFYHV